MKIDTTSTSLSSTQQQNVSGIKSEPSAAQSDPQKELEFQKAVKFGYVNCLQVLTTDEIQPDLELASSEINEPPSEKEKELQNFLGQLAAVAIVTDNDSVLRCLLEFECSLNFYSFLYMDPPIILAAKYKKLVATELLLNHLRQLNKKQQASLIYLIEEALKISAQQKDKNVNRQLAHFFIEFNSD